MAQHTAPFHTGRFTKGSVIGREANEDQAPFVRVAFNSSGKAAVCDASTKAHAILYERGVDISEEPAHRSYALPHFGTVTMVAAGAITAGNPVFAAADGEVAASGTVFEGIALTAATAAHDLIEVLMAPDSATNHQIFYSATTVSAAQAAANSGDGRADIDTGWGVAPSSFLVFVTNASDNVTNTGYVVSALSGGDLGKIRVDGVSGGVQLDENDVVHLVAFR